MSTREQYYRYDRVQHGGKVTLTIESKEGGVIDCRAGSVREMYKYRQLHYPNAHNYRHHFSGEEGCPTCERIFEITRNSQDASENTRKDSADASSPRVVASQRNEG